MSDDILKELMQKLNIPNISRDTKCWIVRCEKGYKYYDNFKEHGIAAIGHIDSLGYKSTQSFLDNIADAQEKLISRISKSNPDLKEDSVKRIASKYINQSLTFINEIKEGDYVITIGDDKILVGYAEKYYGISEENLSIGKKDLKGEHYNIDMTLSLRRDVTWTYEIDKEKLPTSLFKALLSQSTVYNFKDINSLLHLIYPMYIFESQLFHFSININQKSDLNNFQISKMFMLLNQFEFMIQESNNLTLENFDELFSKYSDYNLVVKAKFMSEGSTWASILLEKKKMANGIILYGMLFGNSYLGMDGVIDKELRHKIYTQIFPQEVQKVVEEKVVKNQSIKEMFESLELKKPEEEIE